MGDFPDPSPRQLSFSSHTVQVSCAEVVGVRPTCVNNKQSKQNHYWEVGTDEVVKIQIFYL